MGESASLLLLFATNDTDLVAQLATSLGKWVDVKAR